MGISNIFYIIKINNMNNEIFKQLGTVGTYDEQIQQFLKEVDSDFLEYYGLTPSQLEIARMPQDQLLTEYELVKSKTSSRSAAQRRMIVDRVATLNSENENV